MNLIIKKAMPRPLLHTLSLGMLAVCCLIHMHTCNTHSLKEYGDGIGLVTYSPHPWMSITHTSMKIDAETFILSCYAQDFQDMIDKKQNKLIVKYRLC